MYTSEKVILTLTAISYIKVLSLLGQLALIPAGIALAGETNASYQLQAYQFDSQTGEFSMVPYDITGIDSLLAISNQSQQEDPQKAAYAAFQAMNIAEAIGYDAGLARAHLTLGELYYMFIDYINALEQFNQALDVKARQVDKNGMGNVLNNIGLIHLYQKEYGKARECFEQALELIGDSGSRLTKAEALTNLGLTSYHLEDYAQSIDYYSQVLELTEGSRWLEKVSMQATAQMGNTFSAMTEFNKAEGYLQQALTYFGQKGYQADQNQSHLFLAVLYRKWGRFEDALDQVRQAMVLAETINDIYSIREGHRLLSSIYEDNNDTRRALLHYKNYHEVHNQLLNRERDARLNQRRIQHDVAQKNREISVLNRRAEIQEKDLANQALRANLILAGLGFTFIIALLLYSNNRVKKTANHRLQQKREEIERQNSQLVRLNQEKDEFLQMAAHDLRNPLAAIKGVVNLIEDEKSQDPETLELTDLIKVSTKRMLALIDDFLNVSVNEEEVSSLKLIPVDINKVVAQVTANFNKVASDKEITLIINQPSDPGMVLADDATLRRVLENLISNAIKFSPTGSAVEIGITPKVEHLEVSVKDAGPGISDSDQAKMFKRFTRLSNKPTGNETSTGLGLYIIKKFTEAMGGSIGYERVSGGGSVFTLSLPVV